MRSKAAFWVALAIAAIAGAAYIGNAIVRPAEPQRTPATAQKVPPKTTTGEDMGGKEVYLNEAKPSGAAKAYAAGSFVNGAKNVSGRASLISGNAFDVLRFENFKTALGPDLHIYLSASPELDDVIHLGKLRASSGNVNYEVAKSIDTGKYRYVLVYCNLAKVVFGYAELAETK